MQKNPLFLHSFTPAYCAECLFHIQANEHWNIYKTLGKFTFHFCYLFIWHPIHILLSDSTGHVSKAGFELEVCLSPPTLVGLSHLYSFPNDFPKQENGEDATTFKVTFRSKEYRAQKKHTFNFFAALWGAQRIQKAGSGIRATALE